MVDRTFDQFKIIGGHLARLSFLVLHFELELNGAEMTHVDLVVAVALVGKVKHVDTLAVEGNQPESVRDLLVLKG